MTEPTTEPTETAEGTADLQELEAPADESSSDVTEPDSFPRDVVDKLDENFPKAPGCYGRRRFRAPTTPTRIGAPR